MIKYLCDFCEKEIGNNNYGEVYLKINKSVSHPRNATTYHLCKTCGNELEAFMKSRTVKND